MLGVRVRVRDDARGVVQLQGNEVAVHVRLERGRAHEVAEAESVSGQEGCVNIGECGGRSGTYFASSVRSTNL